MYAERYDRSRRVQPGSLAVALAINAAVLGAVLLAPPEIFKPKPPTVLTGINIPLPPPPPPNDPVQPKAQADPTPDPKPVIIDPIVTTRNDPVIALTGTTAIPSGPVGEGNGANGGGVAIDPPAPPPVFVDPEIDRRFADGFQPQYPPRERQLERDGSVVLRVLVGIDGRVKQVERQSATSDDFFNETRRTALAKWRFRPATRNGEPIERWKTMRVTFRLDDA